jgi:hypothetical protein
VGSLVQELNNTALIIEMKSNFFIV